MCEMAVEHAPDYQVWWNVSPRSVFQLFYKHKYTLTDLLNQTELSSGVGQMPLGQTNC